MVHETADPDSKGLPQLNPSGPQVRDKLVRLRRSIVRRDPRAAETPAERAPPMLPLDRDRAHKPFHIPAHSPLSGSGLVVPTSIQGWASSLAQDAVS